MPSRRPSGVRHRLRSPVMPCAPQSTAETDQSFALLAGILSFILQEFGISVIKLMREQYRAWRTSQQDVERRLDLASITRTVAENNRVGASEGDDAADASGSSIRSPSRTNSGIAAEEDQI